MPAVFEDVLDMGSYYLNIRIEYIIIPEDMSVGFKEDIEFLVFLEDDAVIDGKSYKKGDCISHLLTNKQELKMIDACMWDNEKMKEYDVD